MPTLATDVKKTLFMIFLGMSCRYVSCFYLSEKAVVTVLAENNIMIMQRYI
jgi:hypothetical protein